MAKTKGFKTEIKRLKFYCSDGKYHYLKVPVNYYAKPGGKNVEMVDIRAVIKAEKKAGYYREMD